MPQRVKTLGVFNISNNAAILSCRLGDCHLGMKFELKFSLTYPSHHNEVDSNLHNQSCIHHCYLNHHISHHQQIVVFHTLDFGLVVYYPKGFIFVISKTRKSVPFGGLCLPFRRGKAVWNVFRTKIFCVCLDKEFTCLSRQTFLVTKQ